MIDINKYKLTGTGVTMNQGKLIPGATTYWGFITGNISDQTDLMGLLSGFVTESWVESQGYIGESGLSSYATKEWVSDQGYLTEHQDLTGYATESWVESQGYLTAVPAGYATESWVVSQSYITSSALSSYATKSWVSDQGYATGVWVEKYTSGFYAPSEGYSPVEYDREIPIGDPDLDEYVDVLNRDTEDWSGESEEVELTKQLVLGYKKDGYIYDTIVVNNGFDDQLQLGYQEMFVESDGGTPFLVKGEFRPFYAPEIDHCPVESIGNELTLTEDGGYEIRYIPIDIDNPYSESPYEKMVFGFSTAENTWNGLTIRNTGDEDEPVEVGLQGFSIEYDAETGNQIVVEGDYYAFATKDYVDGLVGSALEITNEILDQEEE